MSDIFKETITFEDAGRIAGPQAFNIMLKPAGSLCNLGCRYCYYLDKAGIYGGHEPRMGMDMLETTIREYIAANDVPEVTFNWHGGEPLILGLDFYRKAVELERKYGEGRKIHNTLQTNGTLITQEWADFFKSGSWLIGISIDGPEDIHDRYRKDKAGAPSFAKVMRGLEILRRTGVEFNTMSTVNRASEGRGLETYQFLKAQGSRFMQFMPVLEHVNGDGFIVPPGYPGAKIARWSVSDIGYGRFLCDIFDHWVRDDIGKYYVTTFDATLACWAGAMPGTCVFAPTCGGNSVIEHNGDLYPCDHFVYREYLLGNIREHTIREMMESGRQVRFGIDKRNTLPRKCRACEYLFACNGECPKHRFNVTDNGEKGLNALCAGYRMYFRHVAPYMEEMKRLLLAGMPPALLSMRLKTGLFKVSL